MAVRDKLLQRLESTANLAAEEAIAQALTQATPQEQRPLVELIMRRNRRPGWITLIRNFDALPHDLQQLLLSNPRDLFGPLSDSLNDNESQARANVIEIVRKAADFRLIFLLTETLTDARTEVRGLAAEAILEAIRRYDAHRAEIRQAVLLEQSSPAGTPLPVSTAEIADPAHLRKAVDSALRQFKTHKNVNVVQAALVFERQLENSPLWTLFNDSYDDATRQANQLLRQVSDPNLIPATLLALGTPLKAAAVAGLTACDNPAAITALAQESYRLVDPILGAAAKGIGHPRCLPVHPLAKPWTNDTWFAFLRLIETLGLEPVQKLPWLIRLGESVPPAPLNRPAKLLLLRAYHNCPSPETTQAILPLTGDTDPVVARSAARYILQRRANLASAADWKHYVATLMQSPHESVRKLISQAMNPGQFERLWHEYLRLPPAVQVFSTRSISETDAQFDDLLRSRLSSTFPVDLAQGLKMLTTLPNLKPFREQIIGLCGHEDPRISSTAVRLVGRLEDPKLKTLLEAATHHQDPRVRANAIESMDRLQVADKSSQVLALLNSRFNRERANAIHAICKFDFVTARECLLKMLQDPSPHHRISALWVVAQLDFIQIARQVAALARRDTNLHVRKRAEELLSHLHEISANNNPTTKV